MARKLDKLTRLLKSIEGVSIIDRYSDHDSGRWVQTSLDIKTEENNTVLGILNHVYEGNLVAKLYRSKRVQMQFPSENRGAIREKYHDLEKGLRDLGYSIEKLPDEDSIGSHVIMWQ